MVNASEQAGSEAKPSVLSRSSSDRHCELELAVGATIALTRSIRGNEH
jgi:hypothetical protein